MCKLSMEHIYNSKEAVKNMLIRINKELRYHGEEHTSIAEDIQKLAGSDTQTSGRSHTVE